MTNPIAVVERLLPAPCDVVYDEWVSAESLLEWMCPRPAGCAAWRSIHLEGWEQVAGSVAARRATR